MTSTLGTSKKDAELRSADYVKDVIDRLVKPEIGGIDPSEITVKKGGSQRKRNPPRGRMGAPGRRGLPPGYRAQIRQGAAVGNAQMVLSMRPLRLRRRVLASSRTF